MSQIEWDSSKSEFYKNYETILRSTPNELLYTLPEIFIIKYLNPFPTSTKQFDSFHISQIYPNFNSNGPNNQQHNTKYNPISQSLENDSDSNSWTHILGWIPQLNNLLIDSHSSLLPIIGFDLHPGLVYLPGYFNLSDQVALADQCLREYVNPPNQSNISRLLPSTINHQLQRGSIWPGINESLLPHSDSFYKVPKLNEIRWVTLGFQYDWSSRTYDSYHMFPTPLRRLVIHIVDSVWKILNGKRDSLVIDSPKCIQESTQIDQIRILLDAVVNGWKSQDHEIDYNDSCPNSYNYSFSSKDDQFKNDVDNYVNSTTLNNDNKHWYYPNCGILNIYRGGDRLRGHVDDIEGQDGLPLVSISLGEPCIFLIGGKSRLDSPVTPICLRSGDVLILGGPGRLNYHGVPRLLSYNPKNFKKKGKGFERPEFHSTIIQTGEVNSFQICEIEFSPLMTEFFNLDSSVADNILEGESNNPTTRKDEIKKSLNQLMKLLSTCRLNLSIRQKSFSNHKRL